MSKSQVRSEKFERGLKTRRSVLGDAYVDRSLQSADEFNWPMQQLATEYCWDEVWNRPGLDRRSRSLLNLGMIAALNRPHELKIHVRGAQQRSDQGRNPRGVFAGRDLLRRAGGDRQFPHCQGSIRGDR
jgi:4-carboxymuconolactone decarboxylase